MPYEDPEFAEDALRGASAISAFLYGTPKMRRKVYHLAATSKLPFFKIGSLICARKSELLAHFKDQTKRHGGDDRMQK